MGKRHRNVTNISEVEPRVVSKGKKFGFTGKRLGQASGAVSLGCGYFEVEPWKTAVPNHYHRANEEEMLPEKYLWRFEARFWIHR